MFRSQKSKSLKVQRETVRILAGSQLASAQGGGRVGFDGPIQSGATVAHTGCINDCLSGGVGTGVSQSAPGACPPVLTGPSIIVNPFPSLREP
jgi:hypothetical protein